jgi:3-dehydroquinate synthase
MHSKINQQIEVVLPDTQYPIIIGENLLGDASIFLPWLPNKKVAIVTNTTLAALYLASFVGTLKQVGVESVEIILPDGEAYKTMESLNVIFERLLAAHCERRTPLLALGGGVIGDMTGFAAACYQRGAPFIQVPTTLLAQVDSSVGGKTAVNHPLGKNMIGAFYQPRVVVMDLLTLDTLPPREWAAGMAEVIKYGLLGDASFIDYLEENLAAIQAQDRVILTKMIAHCCKMKVDIVGQDEKEQGIRATLNLGHTFGHAIESGLGFGVWLHGEAVAAGMMLAAEASYLLGYLTDEAVERIKRLLLAVGLPVKSPDLGFEVWMQHMSHDKKCQDGHLPFVLMKGIGHAVLERLPEVILRQILTGRWIEKELK